MNHTDPASTCEGCKKVRDYMVSRGMTVAKEEDTVSDDNYKVGDRVRVTYDTEVTRVDASDPDRLGVKSPLAVYRDQVGDSGWVVQPAITVTAQYLTRLGPAADPVGTVRVRRGKDYAVAQKWAGDTVTQRWYVLASKWPASDGGLDDEAVADWDVLGEGEY